MGRQVYGPLIILLLFLLAHLEVFFVLSCIVEMAEKIIIIIIIIIITPLVIVKDQSSHLVYPNMHKITNLWKFWLNWSSNLQEHTERICFLQNIVCFQMHNNRLQLKSFITRVRNDLFRKYFSEKTKKLCYFRESRFSQCFTLPTALHHSLPIKCLCLQ